MSKQPGQIRSDYTKTEEILAECEKKIAGGYKDKKTGNEYKYPIIFESEIDGLIEEATEQKGILKDNQKYVKSEKSRQKNSDYQERLTESINGLKEKKRRK